jgi:DNA-binding NarL/FixJ family response regulator
MIRIQVCEDDPRFRALLCRILTGVEGFTLAGEAASGEEVCRQLVGASDPPDLLLLDLELPGMSGIDVVRALTPALPGLEILILTTFADENRVFEAMRAGAAGYLVKGIAPRQLEAAIREVMAGGAVIEPRLARRFWNLFSASRGQSSDSRGLTPEELEVLTLVARGLSNPEAARVLGESTRAVKTTLQSIYRKLGVSGRVEATVAALQAGLISL